jgi:ribosome-associated toxin RatA of RatAB toxin-antitoxin module
MTTVLKSAIVAHSCATMFDLVDDAASYPEFLPWCPRTQVFERTPALTRARIEVDYHGLKAVVATRNAKQYPHGMTLELVEGPFERFRGEWRFAPLGEQGCRVEFSLDYTLAAGVLEPLLASVFGQIADTLVERFVERADALAQGQAR